MIEFYDFGRIVINANTYNSDIVIIGETVHANWRRKEGHKLLPSDIENFIETLHPDAVVIGTGYMGMMKVPKETREYLNTKCGEVLIERTKRACDLFNQISRSKLAMGGFHLTC